MRSATSSLPGGSTEPANPRCSTPTHAPVATGAGTVEIDFTEVDYINSTGIALVVRVLAEARRDERAVRAVGLTEHYKQIFTITRLSDFMTIVDDEETQA